MLQTDSYYSSFSTSLLLVNPSDLFNMATEAFGAIGDTSREQKE